jgi:hypothetical protein
MCLAVPAAEVFPDALHRRPELPFAIQPDDLAFLRRRKNILDPIQDSVHPRADQRARLRNPQQEYLVYGTLPLLHGVMAQAATAQQSCQMVISPEIDCGGVGNIDGDKWYPRILEFRGNHRSRTLIDLELDRQVHTLAD